MERTSENELDKVVSKLARKVRNVSPSVLTDEYPTKMVPGLGATLEAVFVSVLVLFLADLGNKTKSTGLQGIRWYCQVL